MRPFKRSLHLETWSTKDSFCCWPWRCKSHEFYSCKRRIMLTISQTPEGNAAWLTPWKYPVTQRTQLSSAQTHRNCGIISGYCFKLLNVVIWDLVIENQATLRYPHGFFFASFKCQDVTFTNRPRLKTSGKLWCVPRFPPQHLPPLTYWNMLIASPLPLGYKPHEGWDFCLFGSLVFLSISPETWCVFRWELLNRGRNASPVGTMRPK